MTAVRTPFGLFQWKVLSMGLTNAPVAFAAFMAKVFDEHLGNFVYIYLDDIIIFSKSKEEHLEHLQKVFDVLRKEQLFIKLSKCEIAKLEVTFLGHIVGKFGVKVDVTKFAVIHKWKTPTSLSELRKILGLDNFFRRFIIGYSSLTAPLTDLTSKKVVWSPSPWTDIHEEALQELKKRLTSAPLLVLPNFEKQFTLVSDASLVGTGAVLMQDDQPVAYSSTKFNGAEKNYSTTEQELLAVVKALKEFRCYLEGAEIPVKLVTDQHPNIYLRTQPHLSRRQVGWVEWLERFNYEWKYIPGRENVADPLSRNPSLYSIAVEGQT